MVYHSFLLQRLSIFFFIIDVWSTAFGLLEIFLANFAGNCAKNFADVAENRAKVVKFAKNAHPSIPLYIHYIKIRNMHLCVANCINRQNIWCITVFHFKGLLSFFFIIDVWSTALGLLEIFLANFAGNCAKNFADVAENRAKVVKFAK